MKRKRMSDYFLINCEPGESGFNCSRATKTALKEVLPQIIMHELTEQQRKCIELRFSDLLSQQEIAQRLNLSQPTVSRHLRRAMQTVSNRLGYCRSALSRANAEWLKYIAE